MGNTQNTRHYSWKKPSTEFLVKILCALCIATMVILIIISCACGIRVGLASDSRTKTEFRTNASPLCQWQADFGTKYYLITKKHL